MRCGMPEQLGHSDRVLPHDAYVLPFVLGTRNGWYLSSLRGAHWVACRCITAVSLLVVQGRQAAASVRRDLQQRYERCAEVAFGSRAAVQEAGYEAAPLETVVQVRTQHHHKGLATIKFKASILDMMPSNRYSI